jgi:uncharacterized membrane protein YedE/YeeE
MHGKHIALGALFGFILSRAGATDYDAISGMFRLTDLHLFGVIGLAVAVSAAGFFALRGRGIRALNGETLLLTKKPMTRGLAAGALLFGVGWAVAGTCPGTALAQIGEGRLAGLVTFSGMLAGAWLHGRLERARRRSAPGDSTVSAIAPTAVAASAAD